MYSLIRIVSPCDSCRNCECPLFGLWSEVIGGGKLLNEKSTTQYVCYTTICNLYLSDMCPNNNRWMSGTPFGYRVMLWCCEIMDCVRVLSSQSDFVLFLRYLEYFLSFTSLVRRHSDLSCVYNVMEPRKLTGNSWKSMYEFWKMQYAHQCAIGLNTNFYCTFQKIDGSLHHMDIWSISASGATLNYTDTVSCPYYILLFSTSYAILMYGLVWSRDKQLRWRMVT